MITVIEVIKALSGVVESVTGSPPTTKDVTEGFDRPSTWIRPITIQPEMAHELQRDYLQMEIVYFATRSWMGWRELLHVQAGLAAILTRPVMVNEDFAIYPENIDFEPSREDMTLVCTFDLENYQLIPPTQDELDAPDMEHLRNLINGNWEIVDPPEED